MKGKANRRVTQEEISAAIARFRKQGGIIAKLPEQKARGKLVGEKYEAYESLSNLPFYH